jgi:hypothetical protein
MMLAEVPLLITSAILPASGHLARLSSPEDRLTFTAEGIENWLKIVPNLQIVICDGSGYDLRQFARRLWPAATIEVLWFNNDTPKVSALGKGYGEGEIIAYALERSSTLRRHGGFMKCTSKYWISNFWAVQKNYQPTQFHIRRRENHQGGVEPTEVDTRFFFVEKNFHQSHLETAYQEVARDEGRFIEHVFLNRLLEAGDIERFQFPVKPKVNGVSGTSGVRRG